MKKLRMAKIVGATLALAAAICISGNSNAQAQTITWVGSKDSTDWSTATNWNTGTVPTKDDDVILDNTKVYNYSTDDTAYASIDMAGDVEVGSITVSGSGLASITAKDQDSTLTVYGDVISNVADKTLQFHGDTYNDYTLTVKLGANAAFSGVAFATNNTILDLNGATLSIDGDFYMNASDLKDTSKITGKGVINVTAGTYGDDTTEVVSLGVNNDYTGTTNVSGGVMAYGLSSFGTSEVNVNGGTVSFALYSTYGDDLDGKSIANKININGLQANGYSNLQFDGKASDYTDASTFQTVKVPNITLLTDAKFSASTVKVDVDGIVDNGHCITYSSSDKAALFLNAPTQCDYNTDVNSSSSTGSSDNGSSYPGVPSTGLAKLASPLVALAAGIAAVVAVLAIRKRKTVNK